MDPARVCPIEFHSCLGWEGGLTESKILMLGTPHTQVHGHVSLIIIIDIQTRKN